MGVSTPISIIRIRLCEASKKESRPLFFLFFFSLLFFLLFFLFFRGGVPALLNTTSDARDADVLKPRDRFITPHFTLSNVQSGACRLLYSPQPGWHLLCKKGVRYIDPLSHGLLYWEEALCGVPVGPSAMPSGGAVRRWLCSEHAFLGCTQLLRINVGERGDLKHTRALIRQ